MFHPPTLVSNHHGSTGAMFFWHTHQSDNGTLGGELCSTEQGPDEAVDLFLLRIVSVIFRRNLQLLHPKSTRRKCNICLDLKIKMKTQHLDDFWSSAGVFLPPPLYTGRTSVGLFTGYQIACSVFLINPNSCSWCITQVQGLTESGCSFSSKMSNSILPSMSLK